MPDKDKKKPPSHLELLGGKKEPEKGAKKKPQGFKARKVQGGWHLQHHDEEDVPIKGAEHVLSNTDALHDHIEQHFGEPNQDEEAPGVPV